MKKKYIAIVLLLIAGLALVQSYTQILLPTDEKHLLEYYDDLRLQESKKIYDDFFDQAENAAWVLWADNGIIHYQDSIYRVSVSEKLSFAEDTFLVVADGYKARLYGEDWVLGSETRVLYIPAGTNNYINIGKEYNTEITVEEARESIAFFTRKEVEKNLDRITISKTDRVFLNELLSHVK